MARILAIETSTKQCSVALGQDGSPVAGRSERDDHFIHSEKLHLFLEALMAEQAWLPASLDAIAVSLGPGSYTGLRIGVSAAKGLAHALNIPVIGRNSLSILASGFAQAQPKLSHETCLLPLLDARRMEVYAGLYRSNGQELQAPQARIVEDAGHFDDWLPEQGVIHVFGDGAEKCQTVLGENEAFQFHEDWYPEASMMIPIAEMAYRESDFLDLAYFEPIYLKSFQATKAKKWF